MEHTKGDWYVQFVDNIRKNGRPECIEIYTDADDQTCIAHWNEQNVCEGVTEQQVADAYLIAAAKNLLAACKQVMQQENNNLWLNTILKLEQAIAKAEKE